MILQELTNNSKKEFNINLLNEKLKNADFKKYNEFKKYVYKKQFEKIYYNVCRFNQCAILKEFIKLLYKRFKNDLLIDTKNQIKTKIYNYDDKQKNFIFFDSGYCYLSFTINNFYYYIQFDENPFFNNSYINCDRIYLLNTYYINYKERFYIYPSYKNDFNINDLFDIYNRNLNIKDAAKKLYNYFINNIYEIESKQAINEKNFNIKFIDAKIEYLKITK